MPELVKHVESHLHLYAYYDSRKTQPLRVRKFIDFAVERLADNKELTLSTYELDTLAATGIFS